MRAKKIRELRIKNIISNDDTPMETPFEFEQVYDTSIEKVWQALTNENKMRAWYFPQLRKILFSN